MDIDSLLQPLSDEAPCGPDMSFSSEFDTIQALGRGDDPTLPQGEFVIERKVADWPAVAELCTRLLKTRTKDLRVAGWLLEAWSHQRGFAGLADGLLLVEQLCLVFWSQVHPGADDEEQDLRAGSLAWVLVRAEGLTRVVALLRSGSRGLGLGQIEAARAQGEAGAAEGLLTVEGLASIQRETPRDFLVGNLAEAERAAAALGGLQSTLDTLLDAESPSFVGPRKAMEIAVHAAKRFAREGGVVTAPAAPPPAAAGSAKPAAAWSTGAASGGEASSGDATGVGASHASGPLQDRRQAIEQLRAVAEFFRRTEPHSPVAYLADKAARWGDMPLHAWLRAVVKDSGALAQLEDLLGTTVSADNPGG